MKVSTAQSGISPSFIHPFFPESTQDMVSPEIIYFHFDPGPRILPLQWFGYKQDKTWGGAGTADDGDP